MQIYLNLDDIKMDNKFYVILNTVYRRLTNLLKSAVGAVTQAGEYSVANIEADNGTG